MTRRQDQHRFHLRLEDHVFEKIRVLAFQRQESIQSLMESLVLLGLDALQKSATYHR
jgi:hypothetical protein